MKTDLYTKAVLTVIAIALVCLVCQNMNIITPAYASTEPIVLPAPQYDNIYIEGHNLWEKSAIPVYIVDESKVNKR